MFDNEINESEANPVHDSEYRRVDQRSKLRAILYVNIIAFLVYMALVSTFQPSWARTVTSFWVLILVSHAVIVGSLDSRRKMRQAEIERERQARYDLEKPKRRLILGDDGELVSDPERFSDDHENPKRERDRS